MTARICAAIHNAHIIDMAARNGVSSVKLQSERDHMQSRKRDRSIKMVADPNRVAAETDKVKSFVKKQTASLSSLAGF